MHAKQRKPQFRYILLKGSVQFDKKLLFGQCYQCEDIIDDDGLNEYVDSDICNTYYGWRSIRDFLADIPTDYDYYRCDGSFDYVGLDDSDFEDYKARVLDWMDDDDLWEPEEGEDEDEDFDPDYDFFSPGEEEPEPEEPEELPVEEEDFTVSGLMCMCRAELVTIRQVMEQGKCSPDDDVPIVLPF